MDQQTFSNLLKRYLNEELSQEEASRLLDSLGDPDMRRQWEQAVGGMLRDKSAHGQADPARMDAIRHRILSGAGKPVRQPAIVRKMRPVWAAAAVLAIAAVAFFWMRTSGPKPLVAAAEAQLQVVPGGNKAVLYLAGGQAITLDTAGNGAIASQGDVQVIKLDSGQLAYQGAGAQGEVAYNTLATPRGGQFRIILPDGSSVWLNAASSLRFPTAFNGKERVVELRGEAYFEIAKNVQQPFRVQVKDMTVQVLGTHFNVMAYEDEATVRTTLLEGAVKVGQGGHSLDMRPGQQVTAHPAGNMSIQDGVDVEEAVAWKNGYFHFNHESLPGVMRQVGRWYDAEISYEGAVPDREFGGKIARSSSVKDVLKILELSGIRFRIEGKKIIVIP
ncbi:FecR family protein [Chitinophaga rhizosphaerae]|uniref:FecR family protein n=1 Tax=Chitinophaga rhizosphaerae TaxID=1864947 RepID=UPI000F80F303|nr:FecR family protein [Chitinophaga rhizosphaerae]